MRNNRKIFISFYLVAVVVSHASGQGILSSVSYPSMVQKSIVRTYNNQATISYIDCGATHYFVYTDASYTSINYELDASLDVMDFVVLDDSIHFCGVDGSQGSPQGFVGSLSIGGKLLDSPTSQIYRPFTSGNFTVDTLRELVAFRENKTLHLVTIGTASDGNSSRAATLDISESSTSPAWVYDIGISSIPQERILHLCMTDNHIVTAGTIYSSLCSETFRVHNKSSIFQSGGPQDTVYTFTETTNHLVDHYWDNFAITAMTGDRFAVASFFGGSNKTGLLLHAYDIPSFLNTAGAPSLFERYLSLPSSVVNSIQIRGLAYGNVNGVFLWLMDGDFLAYGVGSAIAEIPFSTSVMTTDVSIFSNITLHTLDLFTQYFITQGVNNTMTANSFVFTKPAGGASSCVPIYSFPTRQYVHYTKIHCWLYSVSNGKFDYVTTPATNVPKIPVEILCNETE